MGILVLIACLGSNDFKMREAAQKELIKVTTYNDKLLFVRTTDPEINKRLDNINSILRARLLKTVKWEEIEGYEWWTLVYGKYDKDVDFYIENIQGAWQLVEFTSAVAIYHYGRIREYIFLKYGKVVRKCPKPL